MAPEEDQPLTRLGEEQVRRDPADEMRLAVQYFTKSRLCRIFMPANVA